MAKSNDRVIFTKQMKKDYILLAPMMMPAHLRLFCSVFRLHGYNVDLLETTHANIVSEGLKSVHNDACYPALLVIGQLLDAIKSGKYDEKKVGLMITQTGGGCRASNYIHLLRKALDKNGLSHVPVVSLNLSGMEPNPGFKLTLPMIVELVYSILYGDMLMWLSNQVRPYEVNKGQTDKLVEVWEAKLAEEYKKVTNLRIKKVKENLKQIVQDFCKIEIEKIDKVKVGIVGEIYIKYAPLGNNNLEGFLANEGCEVVIPGLLDFVIFKTDNRIEDIKLYGGDYIKKLVVTWFKNFLINMQNTLRSTIESVSDFVPVSSFEKLKSLVTDDFVGYGNKMGEGWLLTGEMIELCHMGVGNIVCAQPFGCLPNHVAGKGMIRRIKEKYDNANIVAIDYDPGATKVNQENRIKLMLANAK